MHHLGHRTLTTLTTATAGALVLLAALAAPVQAAPAAEPDTTPPVPGVLTPPPTSPTGWVDYQVGLGFRATPGTDAGGGPVEQALLLDGEVVHYSADLEWEIRRPFEAHGIGLGAHTFALRARDAAGNVADTAPMTLQVGLAPKIGAVDVQAHDGGGTLTWTLEPTVPAPTSYTVEVCDGRRLELGPDATSVTIDGLPNGRFCTSRIDVRSLDLTQSTIRYETLVPGDPDDWIRFEAPSAEPGDRATSPVLVDWTLSPELAARTAYVGLEVNDRWVRWLAPDDSPRVYVPASGVEQKIGLVAYDEDGRALTYGYTPFHVRESAPVFTDVEWEHPFYDEILWLAQAGITTGLPDGTFRSGDPITREAAAAFLHRFSGVAARDYVPPATAQFSDVPVSHPFFTEISWLAESGVTTGYSDGRFGASDRISREAMAAFLFRFSGAADEGYVAPSAPTFSDVPVSHPFFTEISWLAESGITEGYDDGRFGPGDPISREAAAAFLSRFADASS